MVSNRAAEIASELNAEGTKLGDIKKLGKELKKDHDLAGELWATADFHPRLLATLIFDKNLLTQPVLDELAADMLAHSEIERNQLADWLLANQLMKSKRTAALIETWEENPSPMLRRLFWYHQARLRWTGKTQPNNSAQLLESLERKLENEEPEVQWTMNFCACQIGLHEPAYRTRCIELGEKTGLYKDEPVARNCTPSFLPEFIRIESAKLKK